MDKPPSLFVALNSVSGRGVFSKIAYTPGDIIEICPVIRVPSKEQAHLDATILYNYYFSWQGDNAISLGFGSLYNHSYSPNAQYIKHFDADELHFICIEPIPTGTEITVNYNGDPSKQDRVWFDKV